MTALDAFLAGERPDDVALFLRDERVDDPDALTDYGQRTADGVVLVVDGERGRSLFGRLVGSDAMTFAQEAMDRESTVARDLAGGTCPDAGDDSNDATATGDDEHADTDHRADVIFAFAEAENPDAGGLYAEGDVIHAYARCSCGAAYSDRWVAEN